MRESTIRALQRASRTPEPVAFWLSFTDAERPTGSQFLGAAVVPATTMEMALTRSHLRGCNPGGSVILLPMGVLPPEEWLDRLLSRSDVDALGVVMEELLP